MARAKDQRNGRLEEAMQNLLQSQALMVQNQAFFQVQIAESNRQIAEARAEGNRLRAETQREIAETNRRLDQMQRENSERFARIEAILIEHGRILQALPEAIRETIGFKNPAATGSLAVAS
jgi:hypothetical protein